MSVVNTETGELVEPISLEEAKRVTEQIKLLAGAVADGIDRLVERIHEAQINRVHEVLGYRSWTEYVSTEFANLLPRLDREPRRELVATLADTGMGTRAIAPIVGTSKNTVARDLASVPNGTDKPTPRTVEGRDGINRTFQHASLRSVPTPDPVVTQDDHDFWADTAAKAEASGYLAKRDAEKPFVGAVIDLTYAAEQVAKVSMSPEHLAANLADVSLHRLPEIKAAAEWLDRFITATKEK